MNPTAMKAMIRSMISDIGSVMWMGMAGGDIACSLLAGCTVCGTVMLVGLWERLKDEIEGRKLGNGKDKMCLSPPLNSQLAVGEVAESVRYPLSVICLWAFGG